METIKAYSEDEDMFVRIKVAEILINFTETNAKNILLHLSKDKEELVRISAYDSLSVFDSKDVEKTLKKAIQKERKSLACAYAIMAWAEVVVARRKFVWRQKCFIKKLKKKARIQNTEHCRMHCYYAQYLFGEKEVLKEILGFLKSSDYHVRCATINTLKDMIDDENSQIIQQELEKILENDTSRAVTSTAENVLKHLGEDRIKLCCCFCGEKIGRFPYYVLNVQKYISEDRENISEQDLFCHERCLEQSLHNKKWLYLKYL